MFVPSVFKTRKRFFTFLTIVFLLFIILFLLAFLNTLDTFRNDALRKYSEISLHLSDNDIMVFGQGGRVDSYNGMLLLLICTAIDVQTLNLKGNLLSFATGNIANPKNRRIPVQNITIFYGSQSIDVPAGKQTPDIPVSITLAGDVFQYPLDQYEGFFQMGTIITGNSVPLQTGFIFSGALSGFQFLESNFTALDGNAEVDVMIKRSKITVGFSIFVISLLWILSLSIFAVSLDILIRGREVAPPLLAFPVSSLFALPALRNTQSGIPAIGALGDVIGLYWNMALVAISSVIIMICFIIRYKDPRIYSFGAKDLSGKRDIKLEQFKGHPLLIVNVASACGLSTSNYSQLKELDDLFYDKGLRILLFPCSQFANQEFSDPSKIEDYVCAYGDQHFVMFEKIDVNGSNAHPLYNYLKDSLPGFLINAIKWNFTKFLIDKDGKPVKRYAPTDEPKSIIPDIEKLI